MQDVRIIETSSFISFLDRDGEGYNISSTHPNFQRVKDALREKKYDMLAALTSIGRAIIDYAGQHFKVDNGVVYRYGKPLHSVLSEKILEFLSQDLPVEPLLRFIDKLDNNPSHTSRAELFDFMEQHGLAIADDGDVLGYKAVTSNMVDKHTKKIDNSVGQVITMPRRDVNDNTNVGCGAGLHFGSLDYVKSFKAHDDVIIAVKVNPQDVVSVPRDCNVGKVRTCRYQVVAVISEGDLDGALYTSDAKPWTEAEDKAFNKGFTEGFSEGFRVGYSRGLSDADNPDEDDDFYDDDEYDDGDEYYGGDEYDDEGEGIIRNNEEGKRILKEALEKAMGSQPGMFMEVTFTTTCTSTDSPQVGKEIRGVRANPII